MQNFEKLSENKEQSFYSTNIELGFDKNSLDKFDHLMGDTEILADKSNDEKDTTLSKANAEYKFSDLFENNELHDAGDYYNSTYDERLKQTPKERTERGDWYGERGESKFVPKDVIIIETLKNYGMDGVTYKDSVPDFSECSESTVQIDEMTENRLKNFKQCDEKCAEQWNNEGKDGTIDWTPRDVANWRYENGSTWHERNDMKTCDLVPTEINDYFGHLGGVSECRKRDTINDGGDFDE